jgi:hypothetical protein
MYIIVETHPPVYMSTGSTYHEIYRPACRRLLNAIPGTMRPLLRRPLTWTSLREICFRVVAAINTDGKASGSLEATPPFDPRFPPSNPTLLYLNSRPDFCPFYADDEVSIDPEMSTNLSSEYVGGTQCTASIRPDACAAGFRSRTSFYLR